MLAMDDQLHERLMAAQLEGLGRGISVLASLDYDWKGLAFQAVKAGGSIGMAGHSAFGAPGSSGPTTAAQRAAGGDASAQADTAQNAISAFLERCFAAAVSKMNENIWLQRLSEVLQMGISAVLNWIKMVVLSKDLIAQLVPGYAAISGLIQTALKAWGTYQHHSVLTNLKDAAPQIGGGIPTVAMTGFQKFVTAERLRAGAHTVYTFGKTLANVLLTIFAAPAASVVGFVTAVVEAIESFVYSAFQAITFGKATDKARDLVTCKTLPTAEEFRVITTACPFAGCVFFGASQYIGGFNCTALLADGNRVLSPSSLSLALTKVDETRKAACQYVAGVSFDIKYHSSADMSKVGHLLKMMRGYGSDEPTTEILSDSADAKTRFKHHARRFGRSAGKLFTKVFG